jgi:hypothetical protein
LRMGIVGARRRSRSAGGAAYGDIPRVASAERSFRGAEHGGADRAPARHR